MQLPSALIAALKSRAVIPLVGAGVSRAVTDAAGCPLFPTWRGLLEAAGQRLREENLATKANRVQATLEDNEYLDAAKVARDALGPLWLDFLKAQFDPPSHLARPESLDLARAIWSLGSRLVLTTNYDRVLRWASPQEADVHDWTMSDRGNLVDINRGAVGHPAVWHLHGFIDRPEEIILTPDSYSLLYPARSQVQVDYEAALSTLRWLLTARTFLFIGFGMEEAIQRQIGWVRDTFAGAGGKHFVLVKAENQEAMEKELQDLSVQPLPFENFGPPLLQLLREMGGHVESGGLSTPAPLPRMEADPRPYLEYLRSESAFIEIRGLRLGVAEAPRFPIDDLYIPLIDEGDPGGRTIEQSLSKTLARLREAPAPKTRLVILGDPGSGKTTFLRRIAKAACSARIADPSTPFPILLRISELSDFIERQERKEAPSLLPLLLAQQTRDLALSLEESFFERQLTKGPCLLLLDGLDEAPSAAARETVSRLIEKAAHAWPDCHFVVTTRPKAYEEEVMLSGFDHTRVGPLQPDAIRTFLERWSAALIADSPERAKRHAAQLIQAVESRLEIRRVARNPVMLTALAALHWNERRMPEQRADLYESILMWLARSRKRRPGRRSPEACLQALQELAAEMQRHPDGRMVQAPRDWAANTLAGQFAGDTGRALAFLMEEEADSGIVVNRGSDVRFWHLTFQEFLAARLLAVVEPAVRYSLLFGEGRAWQHEWREVVVLLAGILHQQRSANVDALIAAALDDLYASVRANKRPHPESGKPELTRQAQCFALLGAMLRDLEPLGYTPCDPRYAEVKNAVLGIFEAGRSDSISLKTRLETAEALGQAGDPRLRLPRDPDYWVKVENFEIGRYPVTVNEYQVFVEDGGHKPEQWDNQVLRQNSPVVNVSWLDAKTYCDWAGVRLPTDAEWQRAAQGAEGRQFPWGNRHPGSDRANYSDTALRRPSPVGLFPLGSTPDGIADLAGNIWEWVADWYDDTQAYRVLRGGSWNYNSAVLPASVRWFRRGVTFSDAGFRCARDVSP